MPELPPQQTERAALCDLLLELGPGAPTLCEGWDTVDLAAHLFVREHRPLASVGIVVAAAAGLHDKAIARAKHKHAYEDLVARVRTGPPLLWKPVDATFNTNEYFVHHEDVRRGAGSAEPRPAAEIEAVEAALWKGMDRAKKFVTRGIKGVRVDLVTPDGRTISAGGGDETVTITGRPGELALYLAGRKDAARVEITGSDAAVGAATDASLGI